MKITKETLSSLGGIGISLRSFIGRLSKIESDLCIKGIARGNVPDQLVKKLVLSYLCKDSLEVDKIVDKLSILYRINL